ncbi:MAG: hypothetical protein ACRCVJ_15830 [Clostridium sp.]|uniref:hypothetical protein n=1 Tax=Clostridium sp. TaxID=1506 RepID=UPI003F3E71F6
MKKIFLGAIAIMISVILIGCGDSKKASEACDNFFSDYKNMELQKANNYVEGGGLLEKSIKQFEDCDSVRKSAINYWSGKISYKILETKKENGNYVVKTEITALNGVDIYNHYMSNVQSLNFNEKTLNGDMLNGENIGGDLDNAFITAIENQTIPLKTTTVSVIVKEDSGTYKIQNDKEVLTAILGGLDPDELTD